MKERRDEEKKRQREERQARFNAHRDLELQDMMVWYSMVRAASLSHRTQ